MHINTAKTHTYLNILYKSTKIHIPYNGTLQKIGRVLRVNPLSK